MKIAAVVCRTFLGLVFSIVPLIVVFMFGPNPPPAPPGLPFAFQHVYYASHWALFVDAVEFAGGVLLLTNRFVPLALTLLAAVIFNITVYHAMIQPNGLPFALVLIACWTVAALPYRSSFAPLLRALPG